jgi:biotin carboxyl carrier protein
LYIQPIPKQVLIYLEAMKMEMPVVAPITGTVEEIHVAPGQEDEAEAAIAMIE